MFTSLIKKVTLSFIPAIKVIQPNTLKTFSAVVLFAIINLFGGCSEKSQPQKEPGTEGRWVT
jgi:hypothetical protein